MTRHEMTHKSRNFDLTLRIAIFFDGDLDFHGFNTSNLLKMKKNSKFRFFLRFKLVWGVKTMKIEIPVKKYRDS